jgi:protein phosphatase
VASKLAAEALTSFIRRSAADVDFSWPYGLDRSLSFDGNRLRTAMHLANRRVFRAAESNDDYNGMGTTVVGLVLNGSRMSVGHAGDSRLYLLVGDTLEQVTRDDSWAASILAQDPGIKPEDLARHPMRNVLTNVVGARDGLEIHLAERTLTGGETMLLCTDGLHGVLDAETIRRILMSTPDVEQAARTLVTTAIEQGSRDNVTAVVVHYEADK